MITFGNGSPYHEHKDRGDINFSDFRIEDLIIDSQWHELDLSEIVPEEAANGMVHIKVSIRNTLTSIQAVFNENGYVNANNSFMISSPVANVSAHNCGWIKMDADRKIQYLIPNSGTWVQLNIIVRGWREKVGGD